MLTLGSREEWYQTVTGASSSQLGLWGTTGVHSKGVAWNSMKEGCCPRGPSATQTKKQNCHLRQAASSPELLWTSNRKSAFAGNSLSTPPVSRGSENLLLIGDETRFMRELTYCSQNLETQLARGNILYFPELWCNLENNTKGFVCLGSDF